MVAADRDLGGLDESLGDFLTDLVPAVVAELGEALPGQAEEGLGGRVLVQDGGRQLAVEAVHVAGELREAEVHQAMQLPNAVPEVLHEPVPQPDELAQLQGRPVGQPGRHRPLLSREASDAGRVDGVGLGPLEILAGEAARPQRVEQGHGEACRRERGEEVLPVVAGGLHGHQQVARVAEQPNQLPVSGRVLAEARRLHHDAAVLVHDGDDVSLGGDVDPCEAHPFRPSRRGKPGASEPGPCSSLSMRATPLPVPTRGRARALPLRRRRALRPGGDAGPAGLPGGRHVSGGRVYAGPVRGRAWWRCWSVFVARPGTFRPVRYSLLISRGLFGGLAALLYFISLSLHPGRRGDAAQQHLPDLGRAHLLLPARRAPHRPPGGGAGDRLGRRLPGAGRRPALLHARARRAARHRLGHPRRLRRHLHPRAAGHRQRADHLLRHGGRRRAGLAPASASARSPPAPGRPTSSRGWRPGPAGWWPSWPSCS